MVTFLGNVLRPEETAVIDVVEAAADMVAIVEAVDIAAAAAVVVVVVVMGGETVAACVGVLSIWPASMVQKRTASTVPSISRSAPAVTATVVHDFITDQSLVKLC